MKGLESVELGFSDIQLVLKAKKKKGENGDKVLLDGSIRGRASPGRLLAIMGPSGAGKVRPRRNRSRFSVAVPILTYLHISPNYSRLFFTHWQAASKQAPNSVWKASVTSMEKS
jgi:hypothetical protein